MSTSTWPLLAFFTLLGLKLADVVGWSWWWVTSPLWIATLLSLVVLSFVTVVVYLHER